MQQDTLVTFLKQLRQNQAQILLALGFFIVVLIGIGIWFSDTSTQVATPSQTNSQHSVQENSSDETASDKKDTTQQHAESSSYTVQAGDSLWSIAETKLGDGMRYRELAQGNNLSDTAWLEIGQTLMLPSATEASYAGMGRDQILYGAESYTVVSGDSLWKIAEQQLGDPYRWTEIYAENTVVIGEDPDLIYPGTELVLPATTVQEQATRSVQ